MRPIERHHTLPDAAYSDPAILDSEIKNIFNKTWQWVGLIDDVAKSGGLVADLGGGLPIAVEGESGDLLVSLAQGRRRHLLSGARAELCGRFVFVRLRPSAENLADFLGDYALVLKHCSEQFAEVYDARTFDWACNWKAGVEIALEGYHVPMVHNSYGSAFIKAVPNAKKPVYHGPHSYSVGLMSPDMKQEMALIARRLKIQPSTHYTEYDHFSLFPNMMIGLSGGNLCFMQIYTPLSPDQTRLRYAYIMAQPLDVKSAPLSLVKSTLLDQWRSYTDMVLGEDRHACENFQKGVAFGCKAGLLGHRAEARVIHMHRFWHAAMGEDSAARRVA